MRDRIFLTIYMKLFYIYRKHTLSQQNYKVFVGKLGDKEIDFVLILLIKYAMTTLTIQIPDSDRALFEQLAKRLKVKIIDVVEEEKQPNNVTKRAIIDAQLGKTRRIENLDLFFKSI